MSIIRTRLTFEDGFTQIPNTWMRDPRLSRRSRGLLAEFMTHRVGWEITIESLAAGGPEGRDAIRTSIRELESAGYLSRHRERALDGTLRGAQYVLRDPFDPASEPMTDNPSQDEDPMADQPMPDSPTTENPTQRTPSLKEDQSEEQDALATLVHPPTPQSNLDFDDVVVKLCDQLAGWIQKNTGRRPNVPRSWLLACRRMIELDGIPPMHIAGAIDWSQQHDFWCSNIMSMTKLREKYPTLLLQSKTRKQAARTGAEQVAHTLDQVARFEAMEKQQGLLQLGEMP